ncbi:hypothetical protein BZG36_02467 [Bifiguratus adelaidae]|uniref:Cytochrome P450 n=1 Tax=Bifiguratus adelaidae TaxID=1938954 RepID=A0A261Y0Y4_9FUNG|nr:hypothetical protein BZG36_02467 [Bifiguratus adelaidae]
MFRVVVGKSLDQRRRLGALKIASSGDGVFVTDRVLKTGERGIFNIVIAEPVAARTLLTKPSKYPLSTVESFRNRGKDNITVKWFGSGSILNLNGDVWKKHRKIAQPAFHKSMPVLLFGRLTKLLFNEFERHNNHVNVATYMQRFTLDAIGNAAFDYDFKCITTPDSREIRAYNDIMSAVLSPLNVLVPGLDKFLYKWSKRRREVHAGVDILNGVFADIIAHKRRVIADQKGQHPNGFEADEAEKDLLTLMLEANEKEAEGSQRLTDEDLRNDLVIFFLAGHDTTSNALTCALYYLARYPEMQKRAREEVLCVLGDEPEDVIPTIQQTKNFPYLTQIINETLRLNPPAIGTASRTVTHDTELNGYFVPAKSGIYLDLWTLHHNPLVWNDPERFDPERFAPGGEYESKDTYAFLPFGHGQRQCVGMQFSLAEQKVLLPMMLRKFDFRLAENSVHRNGLKITPQVGVMGIRDMWIDFTPRY